MPMVVIHKTSCVSYLGKGASRNEELRHICLKNKVDFCEPLNNLNPSREKYRKITHMIVSFSDSGIEEREIYSRLKHRWKIDLTEII
jgi:hypothetical protein